MIWPRVETSSVTYQTPQNPLGPTDPPAQPMPSVSQRGRRARSVPRHGSGRLGPGQKAALIVGAPMLGLLLCCGGLFAAVSGDKPTQTTAGTPAVNVREPGPQAPDPGTAEITATAESAPTVTETTPGGPETTTPLPRSTTQSTGPTIEKRRVTETRSIPYRERTVKDASLPKGTRKVRVRGVPGRKTLVYEVTYTNGVPTSRRLVEEVVTKQPITQVVAVGTKETRRCDPNYSGCVPVASDVDCAGGGGNGPAYVEGPVRVIGRDIYGLDRDGDGYGCDD
jgi:hypothetical protein